MSEGIHPPDTVRSSATELTQTDKCVPHASTDFGLHVRGCAQLVFAAWCSPAEDGNAPPYVGSLEESQEEWFVDA